MDANAGQVIGAGNAGRPLFVRFGRTGATGILSNPGWSDYDSLQLAVIRRLAQGLQVNVAYTWSRAFGICCDTLSDNPPMVQALDYFSLNEARLPQDRPHNFQTSFVAELPFGHGKPFLNTGGVGAKAARRMAGERTAQPLFRLAIHRSRRRERRSICPAARRSPIKSPTMSRFLASGLASPGSIRRVPRRHRAALRHGADQQHARARLRELRPERVP